MATNEDEVVQEVPTAEEIRRRAAELRQERSTSREALGVAQAGAARSSLPTPEQTREADVLAAEAEAERAQSAQNLELLKKILPLAGSRGHELLVGFSPLSGFRMMYEIASNTSPGEVGKVFAELAKGDVEESNEILSAIMSRSPTAQRAQALRQSFGGGAVQGLGEAFAATLELPAELIEALPEDFRQNTNLDDLTNGIFWATDRSREAVQRFAERQDQLAISFGATPEDVIGAKVVGGFVGFTPAIYGSFKAAEIFPFARGAGARPFMFRDLIGGSIMGVAATEGDLETRGNAALTEAAFFGAWSLALTGLGMPLKAFRQRRLVQKLEEADLDRFVREVNMEWDENTGTLRLTGLDGKSGRAVFEILSEEQAVAQSGRAHEVLSRTTDESALVPALMDLAEGEASHGIIRGVKDPDGLIETLQAEFPNLSFQAAHHERGADVIFGTGKLGDSTLKRFTSEGRVPGQRLTVAGQEVEYIGRVKGSSNRIRVRRIDSGREIPGGVDETLVTDLPFATLVEPSTKLQQLVNDFSDQFIERIGQVARSRGGMTEDEVIQAAREGRLAELGITLGARRDFPADGVVGAPEAIGVRQPQMDPEDVARIIGEEGFETFHIKEPAEGVTFRAIVQDFAERRGLVEEEPVGVIFTGTSVGDVTGVVADEILDPLPGNVGSQLNRVRGDYRAVISRRMGPGTTDDAPYRLTFFDDAGPTDTAIDGQFEDLFRFVDEGLGANQQDEVVTRLTRESRTLVDGLQAEAAKAVRQRMWSLVPEKERRLLEEMRDQTIRVMEDSGPSLQRDAAMAGFNVRHLEGGRVELREVNTGLGAEFVSEEAAREALQGVQRRLSNNVGRTMTPRFADDTPFTSHLPPADDFMLTGQEPSGRVLEALTEKPKWINIQKWSQELEERTGIPLWSQVFSRLDSAQQDFNFAVEPWVKRILANWKGLTRKERAALDPFFQEIAGKQLSQAEMIGIGQRLDLSGKQIRAALRALEIERAAFQETGLPVFRYLDNHFARIRAHLRDNDELPQRVADLLDGELPQQAEAFWQKARTGELSQREMDPLLVQVKYIRSVFWDKHMRAPWERANAFLGTADDPFQFSRLSSRQQARLTNFATGSQSVEEGLEAAKIARQTLKNYLGRARGFPAEGEKSATRFFKRLVDKLDLDIAPAVLEDASDSFMSLMYGAAMAGRPRMTARNLSQNLWFSWMRLDGRFLGPALKQAMTIRGWRRATEAGSLRPQQRGVFAGEAAFEAQLANLPERGELGKASDGVTRVLLNGGQIARKSSRVGMAPFGSSDDMNRAWAHMAQEMHTKHYLDQLKRGEIDESTFISEGLRGHTATTKREFARRFDLLGEDEALKFIGKQHADEAHFIYARQAQPMWLQGDVGKFGGMFGTYSLWSKDYMFSLWRNMNAKQRAQMVAKGAAMGGAMFLIAEEMGFDLNNWLSPMAAFSFTGGPPTEIVLGVRDIINNSTWQPERIPSAIARLGNEQARLSYPFQGLQHDIMQSRERAETLDMQILSLILGRPERTDGNFFTEVMLPHEDNIITPQDQVLEALDVLPGRGSRRP